MNARRTLAALGAGLTAAAMAVALPTAAFATAINTPVTAAGTTTITGGTLTFTAPTTVAFTATLAGTDQNVTANQVFNVSDATGSGNGWNITAMDTQFTTGAPVHTLALNANTEQVAPVSACDVGAPGCVVAITSLSYPYNLPQTTATKMVNAIVNTGEGNTISTNIMQLAVPAASYAGSYTSTWTYTLVSAP